MKIKKMDNRIKKFIFIIKFFLIKIYEKNYYSLFRDQIQ